MEEFGSIVVRGERLRLTFRGWLLLSLFKITAGLVGFWVFVWALWVAWPCG